MKHIVSFSGGIGSYMAAKRVAEQYGTNDLLLVFCDTKNEDEDLYRFIEQAIKDIGGEYIVLQDGRNLWEVFFEEKYIGNTRNGNCTRNLKQKPFRSWLEDNFKPDECIVYLGFDWSEEHRLTKAIPHWKPYTVHAPMCSEPYLDKEDMLQALETAGIKRPRLYEMGFSHNNCGGFCVKAGHGHFKNLLEKMPERYAYHEQKEKEWREKFGKDATVLRDFKSGPINPETGKRKAIPMTLERFRQIIQGEIIPEKYEQLDLFDFGGCGCFVED